jgi:hypothetical protein
MKEIIIEWIFSNNNYNKTYYDELLRVNKEIITRWNIRTSLDKLTNLHKIDKQYNAYIFFENKNIIWFCIISNEDWEDVKCSDIKKEFQTEKTNEYWLANFFIYPEFRGVWYWNKCFKLIFDFLNKKNKSFYLYTDESNFARKIYSKYMKKINIMTYKEWNKIIYRKRFI